MAEKKEKIEEVEIKTKFLRTLVREEVYNRLVAYAQSLSTGSGKWDFGVAIESLLNMKDNQYMYQQLLEQHEIRILELEMKEDENGQEDDMPRLLGKRRKKV